MRDFKATPKYYVNSELEPIAKVLNIGFYLLPVFLSIVLIRQIYQVDYKIGSLAIIGIALSFIFRHQFLKGHLRRSVMLITVFFSILLTIICSLGNGIHDIGLVGFPVIIGFSSIILDEKQLIIASVLSIVSLTWLVLGDLSGWFQPIMATKSSVGDFIISSSTILLGGFIAFNLTHIMKRSLKKAQAETKVSKAEASKLEVDSEKKLSIIKEIHHAVINSLNHVQHIIDFSEAKSNNLIPVYESLRRKIIVIETAHQILHESGTPIMLDVGLLTKNLLDKVEQSFQTQLLQIDIDRRSLLITLDDAINYGICLIEILFELDEHNHKSIHLNLVVDNSDITLSLKGVGSGINKENKASLIIDLLTRQLKGNMIKNENEITLKFSPSINED